MKFFIRLAGLIACLAMLQASPASAVEPCEADEANTCSAEDVSGVADISGVNPSQEDRLQGLFNGSAKSTALWLSTFLFLALGLANIGYLITRKRVTGFPGGAQVRAERSTEE